MKNKKNDVYSTQYELVTKKNGRLVYIDTPSSLDNEDVIAKVKVIYKNGKEVSRDSFIEKGSWMTVKEYYESL